MDKKTRIFFVICLILIICSGGYYYIVKSFPKISTNISNLLFTKKYKVEDTQLVIINNSKYVTVQIRDQKKLEQLVRKYNQLFPKYKTIQLTLTDSTQDINFGWGTGDAFGYSLESYPQQLSDPILKISMQINMPIINKYSWPQNRLESETEALFVNSLERSVINQDITQSDTHSETEERAKSAEIENNVIESLEELDRNNPNLLFEIKTK